MFNRNPYSLWEMTNRAIDRLDRGLYCGFLTSALVGCVLKCLGLFTEDNEKNIRVMSFAIAFALVKMGDNLADQERNDHRVALVRRP